LSTNVSRPPSNSGHPRLDLDNEPPLQINLQQRNRWTRRILLAIVAVLALATFLAGIRW